MEERLILIGILLILIGVLLTVIGNVLKLKEAKVEWGFFGLIGPVPIGAWSNKKTFILTMGIIIILVLILTFMKKW